MGVKFHPEFNIGISKAYISEQEHKWKLNIRDTSLFFMLEYGLTMCFLCVFL